MKSIKDLQRELSRIDGKGYKAYKDLEGAYDFGDFRFILDHAQGDPFATPSRIRVQVDAPKAGFPDNTHEGQSRRIALEDFLNRVFYENIRRYSKGIRGTGKSGLIMIYHPGQEIIERTTLKVDRGNIEVRFSMGLPAFGRTVAACIAEEMFFKEIPQIVSQSLFSNKINKEALYRHIQLSEDQDFLRLQLKGLGLVDFVANGSILPRRSGVDDRPLVGDKVISFVSPPSMEVELECPNRGRIKGMAIEKGVTLIVGGGFHGKSTLLKALELGIYNHIPGDGREYVVSDPNCFKIRAEEGRRVEKVDISPFINNLPLGRDTRSFCTDNASGSTSQAANIIEALEAGASTFLIDEDTSASNFMIRDNRMQQLVSKDKEPITPFIDKVVQLYEEYGVSTILVMGGAGDYFDVAHRVLMMDEYVPRDVTQQALFIAKKVTTGRKKEGGSFFGKIGSRIPLPQSFDPSKGKRDVKITVKGEKTILFGVHEIDLSHISQLVEEGQLKTMGDAIYYASERFVDGKKNLSQVATLVFEEINTRGLDILNPFPFGDRVFVRPLEFLAAINRLRTLKIAYL